MKHTLGCLRRADEKFNMISDDDRIAVGVSGGKDSALLLYALNLYRMFSKKSYSLTAVCVDLGFGMDISSVTNMCSQLHIPLRVVKTDIGEIVFDARKEKKSMFPLCAASKRRFLQRSQSASMQQSCVCA